MTDKTIRVMILRALAGAKPFAVPTETLLVQINDAVRPALTADQIREHLTWLLDRSLIDFMSDDLSPEDAAARKWFIREAGVAAFKA